MTPDPLDWCEACATSLHPGVLIMNGDEVQTCDECRALSRFESDDDAVAALRALGLVVARNILAEQTGRAGYAVVAGPGGVRVVRSTEAR